MPGGIKRAHSSRGLGHLPLKEEIAGSNPACATNTKEPPSKWEAGFSVFLLGDEKILPQPNDSNSDAKSKPNDVIEVKGVEERVANSKAHHHAAGSDGLQDRTSFAVNRKANQLSDSIANSSRQHKVEKEIAE